MKRTMDRGRLKKLNEKLKEYDGLQKVLSSAGIKEIYAVSRKEFDVSSIEARVWLDRTIFEPVLQRYGNSLKRQLKKLGFEEAEDGR